MVAGLGLGDAVIEDMGGWPAARFEFSVRVIGRLEGGGGGQLLLGELGQAADGVALIDPDQADALGVAADRPGVGDPGADEDAAQWW